MCHEIFNRSNEGYNNSIPIQIFALCSSFSVPFGQETSQHNFKMRYTLIFFIPLYVQPCDAFLSKFAAELAQITAPVLPTFKCTLHYQQIGDFEQGLSLFGNIHGRLESSPVSWLVHTKWPRRLDLSRRKLRSVANMPKRHQAWCSIIFYVDFTKSILPKEFTDHYYYHVFRTETIVILIRDTLGDNVLHKRLYSSPCLVLVELFTTERFYYLERGNNGAIFRSMPPNFSIVSSLLKKFPSLDGVAVEFFPGILPTEFVDPDLGMYICIHCKIVVINRDPPRH